MKQEHLHHRPGPTVGFEQKPDGEAVMFKERLIYLLTAYCKKLGVDRVSGQDKSNEFHAQVLACKHVLTGNAKPYQTITIEIKSGCLVEVSGLPTGWGYDLIDWDSQSRCAECKEIFDNDDLNEEKICQECLTGQ